MVLLTTDPPAIIPLSSQAPDQPHPARLAPLDHYKPDREALSYIRADIRLDAALVGSRRPANPHPRPAPDSPMLSRLAGHRGQSRRDAAGRSQAFPATLPLADKEVVLTFDDGPWPGTTAAVLDALKRECVRATFFLIGRNAAMQPELVRRELAEGHTIAHHSFSHPLLDRMSAERRRSRNRPRLCGGRDRAVRPGRSASPAAAPHTPFFRFPGLRLVPGPARAAGRAQDRGVRRRLVGERLEPDDPATGIAAGVGPAPGCR